MPGPDPQVPVQGTGSLVPDPDHPRPAALAAHGDLPPPQVDIAAPRVTRVIPVPASSPARIPVAVSTAMIAASRRWANVRPWQVFSRAESSSLVNTGTSFSLTFGARSGAIGSGICSSSASHRKNCCRARNWLLA
jgi:hypothetical protein